MPAHNVNSNNVDINNSLANVESDDPLYLEQQIGKNTWVHPTLSDP